MKIIKRNGMTADFDGEKIYTAICSAAQSVFVLDDQLKENLTHVTHRVIAEINEINSPYITISMIQSTVEKFLISDGYLKIAQHYIEYRLQRDLERAGFHDISVNVRFQQQRG